MPIVEELIEEVREACAVRAGGLGSPRNATAIRAEAKNGLASVVVTAGLAAIRKYFEDYEEVEVDERPTDCANVIYTDPERRRGPQWSHAPTRTLHILVPKPAPEMRTVSRETLAVLAEHYEATPDKDAAGDAALTEAKEAL